MRNIFDNYEDALKRCRELVDPNIAKNIWNVTHVIKKVRGKYRVEKVRIGWMGRISHKHNMTWLRLLYEL